MDDDQFALDFLRAVLVERYPDLDIEVRLRPDPTGEYDLYFIDDDFEGVRVAGQVGATDPGSAPGRHHPGLLGFAGRAHPDRAPERWLQRGL